MPPVVTEPSYPVTEEEDANGDVAFNVPAAREGDVVTITVDPDAGYELASLIVTDGEGDQIPVSANANGTYSFIMPDSQVTVEPDFRPVDAGCDGGPDCPAYPFLDLDLDAWYHDGIHYCVEQELMNGTSATTFEPGTTTTRGMVMTILARLDGVDTSASDPWYQMGMEWAVAEGVSDGTDPQRTITREEIAAMLYRYAGSPAVSGDALAGFPDADSVSAWAVDAMNWAVSICVITGGDMGLDPQGQASRADLATMLSRFAAL